jgi:NAD(P)-dependent dehydrogenase (short-subunit alcohol dehydrogenase family)
MCTTGSPSSRSIERAVATFGRLDMAFNNAGIQVPPSDAADEPAENFDCVNATSWRLDLHEAPSDAFAGQRRYRQLLLAGRPSRVARPAAYHASKHGVIGLTKRAAI